MALYGQNLNFGFVLGGNANSKYSYGITDFNSPNANSMHIQFGIRSVVGVTDIVSVGIHFERLRSSLHK